MYFGTPGGWYARCTGESAGEDWAQITWQLGDFTIEDKPEGWDKVSRFRYSLWSNSPGPVKVWLRGFRVRANDPGRNLLRNGSFEVPGPLPYAWGSGHWGVGNLPWAADMAVWRQHFGLDQTVAHDGKASVRLINGPGLPGLSLVSAWFGLPSKQGVGYTLSGWLRADRAGLGVKVNCAGRNATVTVGPEWQRFVLPQLVPAAQCTVTITPQGEGTLWVDGVQIQLAGSDTPEYHPAAEEESLIAREAAVDWSPPRRTPEVAAGRQTTGPVTPATVSIDGNGRFLLNGQPYLMHSLGLESVSALGMLDVAARAGFPDVCLEIRPSITTGELRGYLDRCAALGLRVIPWMDGTIPLERFRAHIEALRDHPALLCWYVFDEPSGERFVAANERLALARQLDPHHPALINYLGNKLTEHLGDIYSTDIYPIPHSTPLAAINGVAAMQAGAVKEHKPVWMWLQGTGYAYWMDREPTPRELSCMVYGSLIAGARGIYWFAQIPRSAECWAEMRAMAVELKQLEPVLGSLDRAPAVRCEAPGLMTAAYHYEGQTWVLAVNTRPKPMEAKLGVLGATKPVTVVFEDRTVPASANAWTDQFGPYERHVYRLDR